MAGGIRGNGGTRVYRSARVLAELLATVYFGALGLTTSGLLKISQWVFGSNDLRIGLFC